MSTWTSNLVEPAFGPYLFDTSAECWLERSTDLAAQQWLGIYSGGHALHVSAITVMERMRGYSLAIEKATSVRRVQISLDRDTYLADRRQLDLRVNDN